MQQKDSGAEKLPLLFSSSPMKRLEIFYRDVNIILIIIILSLEGLVIEKLKESRLGNEWFILICSVVFLVFAFKVLGKLVEKLVERSVGLRELILGEEYIEGTWFDVVEEEGKKYYGLYTNAMRNGQLLQNGDQLSEDGLPVNSWKTIASNYENSTLTLVYQVNYFDVNKVEQPYGISTISYSKTGHQAPVAFTGTFYEMAKTFNSNSFRGFKVKNKAILKKLSEPEKRMEAIRELIASSSF